MLEAPELGRQLPLLAEISESFGVWSFPHQHWVVCFGEPFVVKSFPCFSRGFCFSMNMKLISTLFTLVPSPTVSSDDFLFAFLWVLEMRGYCSPFSMNLVSPFFWDLLVDVDAFDCLLNWPILLKPHLKPSSSSLWSTAVHSDPKWSTVDS